MRNRARQVRPSALGAMEAWERTLSVRSRAGYALVVFSAVAGVAFLLSYLVTVLSNLLGMS